MLFYDYAKAPTDVSSKTVLNFTGVLHTVVLNMQEIGILGKCFSFTAGV